MTRTCSCPRVTQPLVIVSLGDARRAEAIVNLQAILNIDDTDHIIRLLQQNNWDESVGECYA